MNVLITGVSRGIGLGLAQNFLGKGHVVWAAARNPDASRDMWELERDYGGRVKIVQLDVTDEKEIRAAKEAFGDQPLDLLINNAGVLPKDQAFASVSDDDMRLGFEVNTLGPMRVSRAFLPNLLMASAPTLVSITSKMGSITDNTSGRYYAYRTSKAALNMAMKSFALDHPKIRTLVVHPGWVKTDMGGGSAPISVEASVEGIASLIASSKQDLPGLFYDFRGAELPW